MLRSGGAGAEKQPATWRFLQAISANTNFTMEKGKWYRVHVYGKSGDGGYTHTGNIQDVYGTGGAGGGGSGGYACSILMEKRGAVVPCTVSAAITSFGSYLSDSGRKRRIRRYIRPDLRGRRRRRGRFRLRGEPGEHKRICGGSRWRHRICKLQLAGKRRGAGRQLRRQRGSGRQRKSRRQLQLLEKYRRRWRRGSEAAHFSLYRGNGRYRGRRLRGKVLGRI